MKKKEYYETNYNMDEIEMDPRFVICEKEVKLVFAIQILFTIITIAVAYYFGAGSPSNYGYILGLPTWWFAVIVVTLIFTGIVIYITKFKLVEMSLTDEFVEEEDLEEKGN